MLILALPIWMKYPRNPTVELPTPPVPVVTIMSPLPLPGPVRAIILLEVFHSAESKQFTPHILRPRKQK